MNEEKITKQDIKDIVGEAIEEFAHIVNKGFEEQTKIFKSELKEEIGNSERRVTKIFKSELKEEIGNSERRVIESNEKIAKEVKDMREEQVAIIGGRERVNDTLLNHGDRIDGLEIKTGIKQSPSFAPSY